MYDEQFLSDALKKTAAMVDTVDERYRDAAFPIILQSLIRIPEIADNAESTQAGRQDGEHEWKLQRSLSMSVNEFFRMAMPDSHPARFVCGAYYLLHASKAEKFTQADILEIYGKLREPKPKNPTDVMNQCVRKALIIDAPVSSDKQKSWAITPGGEKYVEELLHGNSISKK